MRRPRTIAVAVLVVAAGAATSIAATRAAPDPPPSSAYLALLPEGEEKRRFILDCTGCHQLDPQVAFPGGATRSRESWQAMTAMMVARFGAGSGFPVIAATREPARTAEWLARHLTAPPPAPAPIPLPAGASVTEYEIPAPADLPHDLAIDADGDVLVTGMFTHRIYRLEPATGAFETIAIPVPNANPRALEIDSTGAWWALLGGPGKAARYRPDAGEWDLFELGTYAHESRVDPAGRVWFNGHFSRDPEILGYLDPASGERRTFSVPPHPEVALYGPTPYGMAIAPDGAVWGTELHGNRVFRFDPATERFVVHTLPTPHSGPRRPAFDAAGNLWIPEYAANRLARMEPDGRVTEFPLPIPDALPYVVAVDGRSGRVWIGTGSADALIAFDPRSERFTVYPLPSRGAMVRHLAIDPRNGDVWAAYGASPGRIPAKIARLRVGG